MRTQNNSSPAKSQTPATEKYVNNTRTLTLLPQTYKNEIFEQNLAYFKIHQPTIFNAVVNYKCEEYRLCSNPDGSPNILDMQNEKPLYYYFTIGDVMASIRQSIDNLSCKIRIGDTYLGGGEESWKVNNPIQCNMLNKLYKKGMFHDLGLAPEDLTPMQGYNTDYFPLIRICGIGLGYHLSELIRRKKISYMTIYEPHVDLFFTSLFTIPWQLIFKYFNARGKGINLVLGGTPDEAIKNNMVFISQKLMPLTCYFYQLNHLNSDKIKKVIAKEPQSDAVEREQADAGWYEDQVTGFYLSARNIKIGNKFYSGKTTKDSFRAFVVGSGPSLNETIGYIKQHQNDAVIFSCGSAITPLLKAGIIPDYEVIQERLWHFPKHEEKHDLDLVKKISLLKLNVVSPKTDKYYKEILVFQKFRDPGSSLLGDNYSVTTAVNPTVTNAGTAICAALGAREIYLFGVDYGAPLHSEKMHAANTIHDEITPDDSVESTTDFDLPGNLGSVIRTTTVLSWSLQTTELKIAEYPNIKWFNVGEGALIKGATPMKVTNLPKKFSGKTKKKQLCKEISNCFNNNYSPTGIIGRLKTFQMKQIEEYFQAILGFTEASPQTREEIVNVLSLLYAAVNIGKNEINYLPSSLLPYGFKQFITVVYIQCSMAVDDDSSAQFFEISKGILKEYIDAIKKDFNRIISYIEKEEETELLKTW